jgi:CO/xanthine dehydrogenase FAD-binding subunit
VSPFTYHSEVAALERTRTPGGSRSDADRGGTDLLVTIERDWRNPTASSTFVRSSRRWGSTTNRWRASCGGACRLRGHREDASVRARFPLLASACEQVATPAIRAQATLAGNLQQRPRCWYFRRGVSCHKSGGYDMPRARR